MSVFLKAHMLPAHGSPLVACIESVCALCWLVSLESFHNVVCGWHCGLAIVYLSDALSDAAKQT